MKKNVLIYLMLLIFSITACSVEDTLEPSNKDTDRVAVQIDLSNETVKNWYNNYNMGVLFEYDNILDFAYVASSDEVANRYGRAEIPQISTLFDDDETKVVLSQNQEAYKQYKNDVVDLLEENVFKYFLPNSKIAGFMPYKVLVSNSIFFPSNVPGEAFNVIVESDSRFSGEATNQLRTVYNENSIVFSVDLEDIGDITKFSKDNFYILFSRIMGMHNLYDLVPATFYGNKENYYGYEMEAIYREENNIDDAKLVFVIDKDWFYSLGFIDAKYFFDSGISTIYQNYDEDGNYLGVVGRIIHYKAIAPDDEFVDSKEKDVRAYLNEMIHRNTDEISAYPQIVRDNMKILLDLFTGWGVDMVGINPDLEVLN